MSTSSSTLQFGTMRRRAIGFAESEDHDDHGPEHSVSPARLGRVVALLLRQNGHWAMASAGRRRRGG